jgi:hypothetical protein
MRIPFGVVLEYNFQSGAWGRQADDRVTWSAIEGFATSMPLTAEVIETAVVRIPSAIIRLVPNNAWSIRQIIT